MGRGRDPPGQGAHAMSYQEHATPRLNFLPARWNPVRVGETPQHAPIHIVGEDIQRERESFPCRNIPKGYASGEMRGSARLSRIDPRQINTGHIVNPPGKPVGYSENQLLLAVV